LRVPKYEIIVYRVAQWHLSSEDIYKKTVQNKPSVCVSKPPRKKVKGREETSALLFVLLHCSSSRIRLAPLLPLLREGSEVPRAMEPETSPVRRPGTDVKTVSTQPRSSEWAGGRRAAIDLL
jgi:hypothetical protein